MKFVYAYCDPRKPCDLDVLGYKFYFEPFYIGKGNKDRITVHLSPSRSRLRLPLYSKIAKLVRMGLSANVIVCRECMDDVEACDWERRFISTLGRKDIGTGPLVNLTDGGEGAWNMSDEVKIKRSAKMIGISEKEYRDQIEIGNRWCSHCRDWYSSDEMGSGSYCKICWNQRARNERWGETVKLCGGDSRLAKVCVEHRGIKAMARRIGISIENCIQRLDKGEAWCGKCKKWKPIGEMIRSGRCSDCNNEYARNWSKVKRGYDSLLQSVSELVGSKISRAVIQAAKRQRIEVIEYARRVGGGDRLCSHCHNWKKMDQFWSRRDRVLGVQSVCVDCYKLIHRRTREAPVANEGSRAYVPGGPA